MTKEELKTKPLIDLVKRLTEIDIELDNKEMDIIKIKKEYNMIIEELWRRIPPLKEEENKGFEKLCKIFKNRKLIC